MSDFKYSKFLLVIPAILLMLSIYPIGINTFLASRYYTSLEIDTPGPAMQLKDVSRGFLRDTNARPFGYPIFHSMVMSIVHIPYIWARTSMLPPYDLNVLDERFPSLKGELIIIMRCTNIIAALGILFISFYLIWLLCKTLLPPFLASLIIALNPDLMFQSSLTYYESWTVFWAMLSLLFFVKSIIEKTKTLFWFSGFMVISALAVSSHERMAGYYIFSAPFLLYKFYMSNKANNRSTTQTVLLASVGLGLGAIAFCLANSVFISGLKPVLEYFRTKAVLIDASPARLHGLFEFLGRQYKTQRHALCMIFWNLGGITPFFSLCGIRYVFKKRLTPGMAILLFPLGYQILSVGLPGWTCGRYIMGQTIFAALFAGFGIEWCVERAKGINKKILLSAIIVSALVLQLFFVIAVKVADIRYHPYRIIESVIKDPANKGKNIIIKGIDFPSGLFRENNVTYKVIPVIGKEVNITISNSHDVPDQRNLYKKEVRNPPGWLVFLAGPKRCYLYIHSFYPVAPVIIEWQGDK